MLNRMLRPSTTTTNLLPRECVLPVREQALVMEVLPKTASR